MDTENKSHEPFSTDSDISPDILEDPETRWQEIELDPQNIRINTDAKYDNNQAKEVVSKHDYIGGRLLIYLQRYENLKSLNAPQSILDYVYESQKNSLNETRETLNYIAKNRSLSSLFEDRIGYMPETLKLSILDEDNSSLAQSLIEANDDLLIEYLVWNKKYIDDVGRELQPTVQEIIAEFYDKVTLAIERQNLPITENQFKARMNDFRVDVCDIVALSMEEMGGYYTAYNRRIAITATHDKEMLRQIIYHELFHHLSGQTLKARYLDYIEYPDDVIVKRVGIAQSDSDATLTWMNEAMTEQLAQLFLRDDVGNLDFNNLTYDEFFSEQKGSYQLDRQLLYKLFYESQELIKLCIDAYFEDYVPSASKILPKLNRFWEIMKQKWGSGIEHMVKTEENMPLSLSQKEIIEKYMIGYLRNKDYERFIFDLILNANGESSE